jgi:phosphopantetheine adenylyltransferase
MIKTSIEKISEDIGFDIANSDDTVQSNLINGFSRGFKTYNDHQYNMQLAYMTDKFTSDTDKLILDMSEYIKLRQAK